MSQIRPGRPPTARAATRTLRRPTALDGRTVEPVEPVEPADAHGTFAPVVRTCRVLVVAAVVLGAVSVSSSVRAVPDDATIDVVPTPGSAIAKVSVTDSMNHGIIGDIDGNRWRWTYATNALTSIPDGPGWSAREVSLGVDGAHGWAAPGSSEIVRIGLDTGAVQRTTVNFPAGDWAVTGVSTGPVAGAAGASLVFIQATSGTAGANRTFLFDLTTNTIVGGRGLTTARVSSGSAISSDGNLITYTESATAGATPTLKQWNRTTDVRTTLSVPEFAHAHGNPWSIGVDATGNFARVHISGRTTEIPVDPATVTSIQVASTGRVVVQHVVPTSVHATAEQVSYWDGTGTLVLLSEGVDGLPADYGVDNSHDLPGFHHGFRGFVMNGDASIIRFPSFASNLPPKRSARPSGRRLFRIRLDRGGMVAADTTRCFDVTGADPGDYVAVNVTPVLARTAGHGMMHSSDAHAGGTSNVNFRPGSVDPNVAIVEVGTDARVCFTNSEHGPVHVIVDELVVIDASVITLPTRTGATRIGDTRNDRGGMVAADTTRCFDVTGADPGDYVAVNVTPVLARTAGHGMMHSSDAHAGGTSNVNFQPGSVDPNVAIVEVGTDARVCFTNSEHGPVHVIVDELVVIDASVITLPTRTGATRIGDTRTR